MIEKCSGCEQVAGETNCNDEKGKPFFLCVKCVAESESVNCCELCSKPINEDHETYEQTDIYLEGNYEDTSYVHTDCRYEEQQKIPNKIKLRMTFLEKQGMKESPEYHSLESILDEDVKPKLGTGSQ